MLDLSLLNQLEWNAPKDVLVNEKPRKVRMAKATCSFWDAYRGKEAEWFDVGIQVERRGRTWFVKWWSNEHGNFTTTR